MRINLSPTRRRPTPVVLRLIIANALIWLVFAFTINSGGIGPMQTLHRSLMLTDDAIAGGAVWQLFTYAFLHDLHTPSHILFNMLGLWFLGASLTARWGTRDFLRFYLISALGAGIFTAVADLIAPSLFGDAPVVGASGAIFGLLTAFSMIFPTAELMLFFVIPVKARHVIWVAIVTDIIFFAALPHYGVAIHTHIGGALTGWLLVTGNWRPGRLIAHLQSRFGRRRTSRGPTRLHVVPGGRRWDA
jgi:membrane associated rhomboid family serine protease